MKTKGVNFTIGYVSFKSDIKVPAMTEYVVDYKADLKLVKYRNGNSTSYVWCQLLYFGNSASGGSDKSSSLTFPVTPADIGHGIGDRPVATQYTSSGSQASSGASITMTGSAAVPTITYTNNTNAEKTYTAYFGFYGCARNADGDSSANGMDATADFSKSTIKVNNSTIAEPSVDVNTLAYDGQNHNFTFTYDDSRVEVTKWEFTDKKGVLHTNAGNPLDGSGTMAARDAGTYKLYFDIKATCGAVWDATTNDQTTKSVSFSITPKTLTSPGGAVVTAEYAGGDLTVNNADTVPAWYDNIIYTDPTILTLSPAKVTEANESGYSVKATIVSAGYVWSDAASNSSDERTFTYKVKKKALEVEFEDRDGLKVAKFVDEREIYSRDSGDKYPKLVTKYYDASGSPNNLVDTPTSLGAWVAVAKLENEATCNYSVNATKAFNTTKKQVAYPKLSASCSDSEEYSGEEQEFVYEGFNPEIMKTPAVPEGAVSFDGVTLKVKNAGKYKPVFTLKDPALYDWSGTEPGAVEIKAKPIIINSDVTNATEWQKGTETKLNFDVPTPLCTGDTTVNLVASYTLNGSEPQNGNIAVNGKSCTVTIGRGFAKGVYVLTVKAADGENYKGSVTYSFEIKAKGLSLGSNDIKWNINGKTFVTADYDNAVFEIEYTGTPLNLTNVKVDFSSAADAPYLEPDGDLTGTFIGATNVGEYEVTFAIKPKNSEETCGDGPFTLKIKIVPQKLDFTNAEWEYSADGGNTWSKITASDKPSYTGDPITVRLSRDYLSGLGLADGDFTENYISLNDPTEQGQKTTTAELTITNPNYTTADGSGYEKITFNWEIAPKALAYSWSGKQTVEAGDNAFEFPAVVFDDGNDYSQYFDYVYTVDGESGREFTLEELKEYIAANWTETTPVSGTVSVRMKDGVTEVNIVSGSRPFNTGTPKTALSVAVTGGGAEYGNVSFELNITRGAADESRRTEVTVSGGTLESAKTFGGDDTELVKFMNALGAGKYVITVSLKAGNEESYVLTESIFDFEVFKRNVPLPTLREIVFTGETIYLADYLDGFDASLMKLIGAAEGENGIVSGRDFRKNGYFTTIALIDGTNYQFVKSTEGGGTEEAKAAAKFVVAFAEGEEIIGSEYEYNWMINRFRITEDMWDKSGKNGATLKLPAQFAAMLADKNLLDIAYSYYDDPNGATLEEYTFKGGNSFWVNATLTGEEANNFEFENGLQISGKTVYEVPQTKTEAFFNNTMKFVQNNLMLVIGCAVGLLLLILLIIIIACVAKSKKEKRIREEQAEQRRLEKEEREREERRLEREERMARMNQQQAMPQMMMPQMMPSMMPQMQMLQQQPQYAPQSQAVQPVMGGGASSNEIAELKAEILAMKAEQAAKESSMKAEVMKAEQAAKEMSEIKAGQQVAQTKSDLLFASLLARLGADQSIGGVSFDKLSDFIRSEVKMRLRTKELLLSPRNPLSLRTARTPMRGSRLP